MGNQAEKAQLDTGMTLSQATKGKEEATAKREKLTKAITEMNKETKNQAKDTKAMAKNMLTRGSIYTHDTHAEVLLKGILEAVGGKGAVKKAETVLQQNQKAQMGRDPAFSPVSGAMDRQGSAFWAGLPGGTSAEKWVDGMKELKPMKMSPYGHAVADAPSSGIEEMAAQKRQGMTPDGGGETGGRDMFAQSIDLFGQHIVALQTALQGGITHTGSFTHEVNINFPGAGLFASLAPTFSKMVVGVVKGAIDKTLKDKFPTLYRGSDTGKAPLGGKSGMDSADTGAE